MVLRSLICKTKCQMRCIKIAKIFKLNGCKRVSLYTAQLYIKMQRQLKTCWNAEDTMKIPATSELLSGVVVFSHASSLQPRGLQPAKLLCPWDFPGKNTGVGCHFLLQGIFLMQGSNPSLFREFFNIRATCEATVHGVTKSRTRLRDNISFRIPYTTLKPCLSLAQSSPVVSCWCLISHPLLPSRSPQGSVPVKMFSRPLGVRERSCHFIQMHLETSTPFGYSIKWHVPAIPRLLW